MAGNFHGVTSIITARNGFCLTTIMVMTAIAEYLNFEIFGENCLINFENFGKNRQINFEETEKSIIFAQKIGLWILTEFSNVKSTTAC